MGGWSATDTVIPLALESQNIPKQDLLLSQALIVHEEITRSQGNSHFHTLADMRQSGDTVSHKQL